MKLRPKRAVLFIVLAVLVLLDLVLLVAAPTFAVILGIPLVGYALAVLVGIALRRSRLIWGLRNRLMVTYVFIGAVPIALILALSYFGAWIVVGQVATHLVRSELNRRVAALEEPARLLSESKPEERDVMVRQMGPLFSRRAPGVEILVEDEGKAPLRCPPESRIEAPPGEWKDYTGLLYKEGRYYAMALKRHGKTRTLLLAPLNHTVLKDLVPGIGQLSIAADKNTDVGEGLAGEVPSPYNALDTEFLWFNPIDAVHWLHPGKPQTTMLTVTTRTSAVLAVVFGDRVDSAQFALYVFVGLVILIALMELGAAFIGFSMTSAITGAVHNLYEGTQNISRGDFSHRIPVKGSDQLADLGKSFNQMSEQLEKLVVVAKEKERMQSELAIACEVQNQLFPRSAPRVPGIEILGACEPARSASGDYYDYLALPNGNLAFAIGDVAGKGISAALLMASIQSIVRTQLLADHSAELSTKKIVAQLSRQLYANTSPEKYATFFFGIYDKNTRELTYTNGGHLAPLLLRGSQVIELEVTGTVVGLFPAAEYEERKVTILEGDLLLAFTDGITEPENAYGEEFGMERVTEAVLRNQAGGLREIVSRVMEAVKLWSTAPELPDDMTVLIVRGVA